jgi:hypothetical protein
VLGRLGMRESGRLYIGALYALYVQFRQYPQFPQYVRFRIVVFRCTKNESPGNRYNASNHKIGYKYRLDAFGEYPRKLD